MTMGLVGTNRPLKIGIGLPDSEGAMNGSSARWSDLLEMAQLAERLGYDSIWNQDHFLFRGAPWQQPDSPTEAPWECWSILAALAAVTTRVELGPLVSCTSFRNPALLAKIADTVDEISGGRLILGLGAGWHEPEYAAYGYPFDHRVSRFVEAITIIHGLTKNGQIDFNGQYYRAEDCELRPRGPRSAGAPIMVGTRGHKMLRLTARFADGWNGYFSPEYHWPESLPPLLAEVDAACVAEGRDPSTLSRSFAIFVDLDGDAPASNSVNVGGVVPISGSSAELADIFRRYAAVGIDHLQVHVHPMNAEGIERLAAVLPLLDK